MGHFFRSLLYASCLNKNGKQFIILINDDTKAVEILKSKKLPFIIVDFNDSSDWVTPIINQYHATVWIQDKFETTIEMAQNIMNNNILFCAIDEFGPGAELCDLHFAGMIYLTGHEVRGKKIFCGSEYVILNPEIDQYRRERTSTSRIIVSLGGSDPFGMTVKIVEKLSRTDYDVEVIIGPDFDYREQLDIANIKAYPVLQNVPSLIGEFSNFDFAITGGGITCCEANSCGLPCMIIANAPHEINTGRYMESKGGALYGGSFKGWNPDLIDKIKDLDIKSMSLAGMKTFDTKAIERIFSIIEMELKK